MTTACRGGVTGASVKRETSRVKLEADKSTANGAPSARDEVVIRLVARTC